MMRISHPYLSDSPVTTRDPRPERRGLTRKRRHPTSGRPGTGVARSATATTATSDGSVIQLSPMRSSTASFTERIGSN